MKILAVDDDTIICELLAEAFDAAGYSDVTTATSGFEALDLIRNAETPFDCFMLDIQMPEMDGIELCAAIKKQAAHKDSPVIMLTAMSEKDYIDRAFAAGASDYVTKPFDVMELFTRVRSAEAIVIERAKSAEKQQTIDALQWQQTVKRRVDIRQDVYLSGVRGALQKLAFENYVLQLGRSGLFGTAFFAFRMTNVQELHENATPEEFISILLDVGDVIADALKTTETFICYRGNGIYAAIAKFDKHKMMCDVQTQIDADLTGVVAPLENGARVSINMKIGGPVQSGFFGYSEPLEPLWLALDTVDGVDSAEPRSLSLKKRVKNMTDKLMQTAAL